MGSCGLYPLASMMHHCCVSNTNYGFKENGQFVIRAAMPITKGTRIYNDYTNFSLFFTLKRQMVLKHETRFGSCSCRRCKDPTELGTFASGVYCPKCPNQESILLSENPLNEDADWLCNKCSLRLSFELKIKLEHAALKGLLVLDRTSIPDCENFITKYAKVLHPHNFLLTDVKLTLISAYRISPENLNDADYQILEKKKALILELLKIADVVSPELSDLRGNLIRHYFAVVDIRKDAGLIDGKYNTDENIGPSRVELELHEKMRKQLYEETV